jgi:ABC-type spermidine/putrescine transport system permease subunit II|tara:strand:- start:7624 stop:7779 length:156 start_codon:yes stop_codon:yes gene_type:complete
MLRKGVSPLINAVSVVILVVSMDLVVASLVLERATSSQRGKWSGSRRALGE